MRYILTFFLLTHFTANNCYSQQLAFPCATGAGAYITGGRGGVVIKVTNLNDSGAGSLRAALTATGTRIIVFDVSGTIQLNSILEMGINNSNFTVAGQTAPEGGITITGKPIQMGGGYNLSSQVCNNGVWRYIRFRNASYTGVLDEYLHNGFISTGSDGIILDHCSFSFCDDQAISMNPDYGVLKNITIQNCIFSENATGIILGISLFYTSGNMTVTKNLFVDQSHRTPNVGGTLQFDIINNVCFNWKARLTALNSGSPTVNYIGNYLKEGSYIIPGNANMVQNIVPTGIYTANNYHSTFYPIPQLNDQDIWRDFTTGLPVPSSYFVSTPYPLLGNMPPILSAWQTYSSVLSDVGSNKFLNADGTFGVFIDSFDSLKISNVTNNISSDPANHNWTLPNLPTNTRPINYDSNNDGLPDSWVISKGFGIYDTLSNYVWPSNYVGIEEFLNEVDTCNLNVLGINNPAEIENQDVLIYPNPTKNYFTIESNQKVSSIELYNSIGQIVFVENNTNIIQVTNLSKGIYIMKVNLENGSITKKVIVE
jgi:Secretion system C-terminal sorting domain